MYLSVKIRTNEEINIYDESQLVKERTKLKDENKVDELTLIEYIKGSIEILMNMKYDDFEKEGNYIGGGFKCKTCKQFDKLSDAISKNSINYESAQNTNRFMTYSQLSGLSRATIPMAHEEYEKIIQNYE